MTLPDWHEEAVTSGHNRESFDCGDDALNDYLRHHARKSHERGGAKTFLAISDEDNKTVLGFYSLSPASVEYARVPDMVKRGLARYDVPVFRLGRLAVHHTVQNNGVGGQLLLSAGRRCLLAAEEVGGVALLIDAKHEQAANWYTGYGAFPLLDAPLSLLLPLATIKAALQTRKILKM
ncbi:MAG: GNAT family N-acetyltransferase [Magnetococcales bacterium]|nr:GNAT family N-acetyltransferase [Magnetococcales bacterium]